MTTDPPPRRKWHLTRWLIVLIVSTLAWSGWRAHTFRSAISQAKALGWYLEYTDPVETIRKNWNAAYTKETWLNGVTGMSIPTSESFEQHLTTVHRLNPKAMRIRKSRTLRDLSALKPLNRLQFVVFDDAKELTNVEALKHLSALQFVGLHGCAGLTNVDALTNLSSLKVLWLNGCTGLTPETVAALKAALPNATIHGPYPPRCPPIPPRSRERLVARHSNVETRRAQRRTSAQTTDAFSRHWNVELRLFAQRRLFRRGQILR